MVIRGVRALQQVDTVRGIKHRPAAQLRRAKDDGDLAQHYGRRGAGVVRVIGARQTRHVFLPLGSRKKEGPELPEDAEDGAQ